MGTFHGSLNNFFHRILLVALFFLLMISVEQKAWAQPHKARIHSGSSKIQPPRNKPFEGEWRLCIRNMKGKRVCASYFFLQKDKYVCGTWQEIDAGKVASSGLVQAIDEQSLDLAAQKNAHAIATLTFTCDNKKSIGSDLAQKKCGSDYKNPVWKREENGWELRTAICKKHRRAIISFASPYSSYSSICPTKFPYSANERNEYYVLTQKKRKELLQLPWMQQCLSGQEPANIAPSN